MRVACLYLPSWIGGLTLGIPSSLSAGSPRTRVRKAVDLSGRPGCIPDNGGRCMYEGRSYRMAEGYVYLSS